MSVRSVALSMGVGAAVGAVAVMMMPRNNPVRKLADKAATTVEDTAMKVGDKITDAMEDM